jgi:asparagine N-glycosylation enzyme membrane subunit Stt3
MDEYNSERVHFRIFVAVLAVLLVLVTYFAGRDISDLQRRVAELEQKR